MNITFSSSPTGQMGNRLFHYNLLWQLSAKANICCNHFRLKDSNFFENLERKLSYHMFFYKKIYISSDDILKMKDDFINFLQENNSKNICIKLVPPLLGDPYINFTFYPPRNFFKIKSRYKKTPSWRTQYKNIIGIHFRGSDFYQWDKSAIFPFKYYDDSLKYILEKTYIHKDTALVLFTDDNKLPTYQAVQNKYSWLPIFLGNTQEVPIYDFYAMSLCDALISTPSTFSIWSGILGKNIKIIHNKEWASKQADNSLFWSKVVDNAVPYYNVEALL